MTWLIAVDESGDTGSNSRYFTMAAIVTPRSRHLLSVAKTIPKISGEFKFYKSSSDRIETVLNAFSKCVVNVVYITVDKYDYNGKFYGLHGVELYSSVLEELLMESMGFITGHDVNLIIDDNSFISLKSLRRLAESCSSKCMCNVKRCEKVVSHHETCVQIADVVVGSIHRSYENGESKFIEIIKERVSIARKP